MTAGSFPLRPSLNPGRQIFFGRPRLPFWRQDLVGRVRQACRYVLVFVPTTGLKGDLSRLCFLTRNEGHASFSSAHQDCPTFADIWSDRL